MEEDEQNNLTEDYFQSNSDEESFPQNYELKELIQQVEQQDQKQQILPEIPEYPINTLVHFQIEIQSGRFEVIFLVDQLQDVINNLDMSGYTILHHAITYNRLDIFKYLLSSGADPNIKSSLNQTSLMIACNFGNREMVSELIQRGADVNARDNFNFNALLYAWKTKFYDIVLYLIYLTDNWIETVDHNLCSLQHWSAYNNDLDLMKDFLLKFLSLSNVSFELLDKQLQTPLSRAINNNSYEAFYYLINKTNGEIKINQNLQSISMRDRINRHNIQIKPRSNNLFQKAFYFIEQWYNLFLCVITFILFIMFAKVYLELSLNKMEEQINSQNFMIGFLLIHCYTTVYTLWFITKSTSSPNDGRIIVKHQLGDPRLSHHHEENEDEFNWFTFQQIPPYLEGISEEEFEKIDFSIVQKFKQNLKKKNKTDLNQECWFNKYTVLEHIYFLWQTKKIKNLQMIDFKRICPICLVYQPPRMKHVVKFNQCVEDFHHQSLILRKCISSSNHLFYLLFLISWFLVLASFNYNVISIYWNRIERQKNSESFYSYLFFLIELIIRLHQEESFFNSSFTIISLLSFIYLVFYLTIEIYLVFVNLTYDEYINNQNYRYLFEIEQWDQSRMKFKYRFPVGYIQNLHNYLGHQFNKLKLK